MRVWSIIYHSCLVWSLAFWLGGFTFYGAVVIPILHERLGDPMETGLVTQKVTDVLNFMGLTTVLLGWLSVASERRQRRVRRTGSLPAVVSLALTSTCLIALFALHRVMDRGLEQGSLAGFYRLHRAYLWVSTVQWVANLGLLACWADSREAVPRRH